MEHMILKLNTLIKRLPKLFKDTLEIYDKMAIKPTKSNILLWSNRLKSYLELIVQYESKELEDLNPDFKALMIENPDEIIRNAIKSLNEIEISNSINKINADNLFKVATLLRTCLLFVKES